MSHKVSQVEFRMCMIKVSQGVICRVPSVQDKGIPGGVPSLQDQGVQGRMPSERDQGILS